MGLFDSLFGSKKTSKQTIDQTQTTSGTRNLTTEEEQLEESQRLTEATQQQTTTQTGATTQDTTQQQLTTQFQDTEQQQLTEQEQLTRQLQDTTQQQTTEQQQVTQNLDVQTQTILQDLIASLSGDLESGGGSVLPPELLGAVSGNLDFANLLAERAGETEGVLNANTDAIVTEARRQGENALELQGTALARGAGSNLNSIVQAINAQGRGDLETQLAGLRGTLGIQARQAGSQDFATAFGALSESARGGADISIAGQTAGTQQIAQLAQILQGATTVTSGQTQVAGTTQVAGETAVSGRTQVAETGRTAGETQVAGQTQIAGTSQQLAELLSQSTEEQQITQLLQALQETLEVTDQEVKTVGTTTGEETGRDSIFSSIVSVGSLF